MDLGLQGTKRVLCLALVLTASLVTTQPCDQARIKNATKLAAILIYLAAKLTYLSYQWILMQQRTS